MLDDYKAIFSAKPGLTTFVEHRIVTEDNAPTRCKLRPVNAKKGEVMDQCLQELLNEGLIEPSTSPSASAPVLVPKKSGGYRLAINYRGLNAKTLVPVYPMPRTDWVLTKLGRAQWFTSFDLSQGFFQIQVALEDIPQCNLQYREEVSKTLQDALDFAQYHHNKIKEVQERQYNKRRQPYEFAVGDLVLHDCHTLRNASKGIASKLAPRRNGPFMTAAKVGPNVYKLKDPQTRRRFGTANVDQLTPYYSISSCTF